MSDADFLIEKHMDLRDMKEHILVTLVVGGCLKVPRSSALDLHTATRLLLDVLDVGTAMSDNLST